MTSAHQHIRPNANFSQTAPKYRGANFQDHEQKIVYIENPKIFTRQLLELIKLVTKIADPIYSVKKHT